MSKNNHRNRKRLSKSLRQRVYMKYLGHCAYCGKLMAFGDMQIDHKIPLSKGGEDSFSNYMPSCSFCNGLKDNLTLGQFKSLLCDIYNSVRKENSELFGLCTGYGTGLEDKDNIAKAKVTFFYERVDEFRDKLNYFDEFLD